MIKSTNGEVEIQNSSKEETILEIADILVSAKKTFLDEGEVATVAMLDTIALKIAEDIDYTKMSRDEIKQLINNGMKFAAGLEEICNKIKKL